MTTPAYTSDENGLPGAPGATLLPESAADHAVLPSRRAEAERRIDLAAQ
jgi:hypothetical protein